jgi:phytol kinase
VAVLDVLVAGGGLSREASRKAFHVAVFTGAVPAHLSLGFWGVVVYGSVLAGFVLVSLGEGEGAALYDVLARAEDGAARRRFVVVPLVATALGGLVGVLLVGDFAIVGYLVCGWGDALGEWVGKRWGRHRYASPLAREAGHSRSLEGSAAVFAAGGVGAALALLLLGVSLPSALGVGMVCGGIGAVAEGLSGHGTDNFWVQVLPTLVAAGLLG